MNYDKIDWQQEAKRCLRAELVRRDVTYKELVRLLEGLGIEETERSIQSKVGRGSFTFAFFLQCMKAIGVTKIDLEH